MLAVAIVWKPQVSLVAELPTPGTLRFVLESGVWVSTALGPRSVNHCVPLVDCGCTPRVLVLGRLIPAGPHSPARLTLSPQDLSGQ